MQLPLTIEDAHILQSILRAYLPGLRREAARTSLASRDLRHELYARQDLCERLIEDVETRLRESRIDSTPLEPSRGLSSPFGVGV
jgi:hypothetical protein